MHIETLILPTRQLETQRRFYTQTLGLTTKHETPTSVTFRTGTTRLTWQQDDLCSGFYHLAWDIAPTQVEAAERWLLARVKLLAAPDGQTRFPPGGNWNTTTLYFEDPAEHILEFVARHDSADRASRPFGAHALQRLSEFGVVVLDVNAAVDSLSRFNGGSDTFTPLGSHEGMLIVVRDGRGWFPTGRGQQFRLNSS
ncbi:glyoxalase/bleomycin resistance/dioxygenase family protein [Deinococcus deserti]|uniref:VOC domain-containing protein n=1 Tax=Deinococcus deserti (strain DSM 17065 / CIP 109153 / LMG 22923 / VCD115) TaxID=546414 RepID=C1CZY3_DEIDV|nr:glyoxalase/bleomycin resistance/dioxygenase family protein [Deinococcus deserti]ACO45235.1 hypothetical protein Deide_04090 [Deinococcus deserti VCD115]